MVEEFLPEEAWIPRSEANGTVEKKILETEEEVPGDFWIWPEIPEEFDINGEHRIMNCCQSEILKETKIDGFEIELINDMKEDINGNLTEEKVSKHRKQNPSKASDKIQSFVCRVCKQQFCGVETIVLHIQKDHRMKGPDNLDSHFHTLVKSGYIEDEKESICQDNLPASKMGATSRVCSTKSGAPVDVTPEKIRCLGEDASVVTMRYTSRLDMKVTKEEQDPLQTSDNSQDLQVPTPVQSWLCGRSSGWDT
eukprot:GFUD01029282.1.p1 GENE.GFUD01029282.1~~GFUD01029282.1.p1  ORF type:complete len:279 (-),score=78.69 GFUD01029282.1:51-806(-)